MKEMVSNDEYALWKGACNGGEAQFVRMYEFFQGPVYRFALHLSGSTSVAEDVVQEVFLFVIQNPDSFHPERGRLKAFLLGVARNMTLRSLGREKTAVEFDPEEEGFSDPAVVPLSNLLREERVETMRKAIAALPETYREAVVLCDLEELSYEDAALALDCPVGTVRSRLHRARSLLLRKLSESVKRKPQGGADYELSIV